jgi:hypothetical protein
MMSLGSSSFLRTLATPARRSARKTTFRVATLALALMAGVACGEDPTDPTPTETGSGVDITLSATSVKLIRSAEQPNPTVQVTGTVKGSSNTGLTWTSGDTRIATVSSTGVVTAVADGSTFITVKSVADPSVNRSVVVNVVSTVVTTTPGTDFLYVGGPTRQMSVTVENNTNTAVVWSSSAPGVATVDQNGVVTPISAGTTNIIATSVGDPAKSAATVVTVDQPHAGYTFLPVNTTIPVSGTTGDRALYYVYLPRGTTNVKFTVTGGGGANEGDADLFIYPATASDAQIKGYAVSAGSCYSAKAASNETCSVSNPQPRIYYVFVDAYETYSGATLSVTTTP